MTEDQRETPKRMKTCSDKASLYVNKLFKDNIEPLHDIEDTEQRNDAFQKCIEDLIHTTMKRTRTLRQHAEIKLEHEHEDGFENSADAWFNFVFEGINDVSNRLIRDLAALKYKAHLPEKTMSFEEKLRQLKTILDVEYQFTQNRFSI